MTMQPSTVGFIGTGKMGRPMAENLLQAGYPVWAYDVDAGKTNALVAAGARRAASLAEAVRAADVVVTMVRNDDELLRTTLSADGILSQLRPDAIHLSTCTVGPETLRQLAVAYQQQGRAGAFVAATMQGRPDFAAAGRLTVMAAGPAEARRRVRPLLEVFGGVTEFGDQPEVVAFVKLINNYLLAGFQAVMGEARAMALAWGIDPAGQHGMLADSPSFLQGLGGYAARIARDDHDDVSFPPLMGHKDMRLVVEAAGRAGIPAPIAHIVLGWLGEAAHRWPDRDWSVATRMPAAEAGLLVEPAA